MPRKAALEPRVTSADVYEALQKRYKDPEYILLREVRNQTGYDRDTSYADAMAFSTWQSRGREIIGMEIKVARSDWLREKKNPKKAEHLFCFCDKWFLVTTPGVAKLDEIPAAYGWLVLKGRRFEVEKEAPDTGAACLPSRAFLASVLRNASVRSASQSELKAARREGSEEARKLYEGQGHRELQREQEQHERLKQVVHAFETASGVNINCWSDGTRIGEAVKVVLHGGLNHVMHQIENAKHDLARQVRSLEQFIEANRGLSQQAEAAAAQALATRIAGNGASETDPPTA